MKLVGKLYIHKVDLINNGETIAANCSFVVGRDKDKKPVYESMSVYAPNSSKNFEGKKLRDVDLSNGSKVAIVELLDKGTKVMSKDGKHYANRSAWLRTIDLIESIDDGATAQDIPIDEDFDDAAF